MIKLVIIYRMALVVGGRLAHFSKMWAKTTPELARIIRNGYTINFEEQPELTAPCNETFLDPEDLDVVRGEVKNLLQKGAIEVVKNPGRGFYSRMFVRPKPDGSWRSILNLKVRFSEKKSINLFKQFCI